MTTLAPWTEQWQHFQRDICEDFWGDLAQHTRQSWQAFLERLSLEARDRHRGVRDYERSSERTDARNGFYERDFVTRLGTLRVRVARTRQRTFLPAGLRRLERRADDVLLLIRDAFLRGLSTRAVGRVVALITEEAVSAQTVSRLTRDLDHAVAQFHQVPFRDDWRYLFLDGVSLRVRRPGLPRSGDPHRRRVRPLPPVARASSRKPPAGGGERIRRSGAARRAHGLPARGAPLRAARARRGDSRDRHRLPESALRPAVRDGARRESARGRSRRRVGGDPAVMFLFAYGTLRRGAPMHQLVEGRATWLGPATAAGRLVRFVLRARRRRRRIWITRPR